MKRGFTLLEALVALVIFGVITLAVSFAFHAALQVRSVMLDGASDGATMRAAFDRVTSDLRAARFDPNEDGTLFVSGAAGSAGSGMSVAGSQNTVLMLSTMPLTYSPPQPGQQSGPSLGQVSGAQSGQGAQSDTLLVRYDYDPKAHALYRIVLPVPNPSALSQAAPAPEQLLSDNIDGIQFRFYDGQEWTTTWSAMGSSQSSTSGTGGGGTGGGGAGGGGAGGTGAGSSPTGVGGSQASSSPGTNGQSTALPQLVEVTIAVHTTRGSTPITTTVALGAYQGSHSQPSAGTGTGGSSGGGSGGTGGSGGSGGGQGPGGPGAQGGPVGG